MKVNISYKNKVLSNNILLADTLYLRLVGLMFKKELKDAEGLLLHPCNSIHTCFMKYPIDVAFISSDNVIIKIIRDLKPWRMTWLYFKAQKTLEMPAGKFPSDLNEGDKVEVRNV